jgi:tetratricopeptide (TPR) repeat protein
LAAKPLVAGDRARAKSLFTDAARLHQQGKLPAAIAGYAKAIAADASYAQPYYNLAIAYRDNRQYDLAFDNYELALQADPQFTDARYNYAILLQNQGYVADALDQYERILRVNPADAAVHLTAAALYARDPATRESARQHYETYLRLSPGSPLARDIRAWLDQNR